MPKLPEPPNAKWLSDNVPADVHLLHAGTCLWRIYFRSGPYPSDWNVLRYYGPTRSRFDHHLLPPRVQERGILYASAEEGPACFAEVFQDSRVIDRARNEPWLVGFELTDAIEMLDLTFSWPTKAGASMAINTGPRPRAQRWARAIYDAYSTLHGVRYSSSMFGNRPLVALFERACHALPAQPLLHRSLLDPQLAIAVENAALACNYAIV